MFRIPRRPADPADLASLDATSAILTTLANRLPDRITIRQAIALLAIARADREGIQYALTHLPDIVGKAPFRSIRRLQEVGLVDMQDSPDDRRNTLLSLTNKGRHLASRLIFMHQGRDPIAELRAEKAARRRR